MVEKSTIICDVCDEHVAKWKCEICDKDVCEDCTQVISNFLGDGTLLFRINTCERCKKQFSRVCLSEENIFSDIMKDKPELKKEIVELVKNILMLKKISDEDINKEETKTKSFTSFPRVPLISPKPPKPLYPYKPFGISKWKKFYHV